jgi:hemerythrin-like domain-containing protein
MVATFSLLSDGGGGVREMPAIRELCSEHRALEEQALLLLRIVAGEVPDSAAVAQLRWRMARMIQSHCEREERLIYDRLRASGDLAATAAAYRCRDEHGALAARFAGFIAAWPVSRISAEWITFRAESQALVAAIGERIRLEETVLYPHARRVEARRAA